MEKYETKVIFSPQLAQWLLKNNYKLIKLKAHHTHPNETVFVFETAPGFFACIEAWLAQKEDMEDY